MLYRLSVSLLLIVLIQRIWHTLNSAFKYILILSSQFYRSIWIEYFAVDFKVTDTYTFLIPSCKLHVLSFPLCFDHLGSFWWSHKWLCDILKSPIFSLLINILFSIFLQIVPLNFVPLGWEAIISAYQTRIKTIDPCGSFSICFDTGERSKCCALSDGKNLACTAYVYVRECNFHLLLIWTFFQTLNFATFS